MRQFLEIAYAGAGAILQHPLRSVTTFCALLATLVPYLVGVGVSHGVRRDAIESIKFGADLYLSATQFGRSVPLPLSIAPLVQRIDGVVHVVPRVVGSVVLGKDHEPAVVVGMPIEALATSVRCVDGTIAKRSGANEFVIGSQLANRLNLQVGSRIPPFYRNAAGERVSRVVGVFQEDAPHWSSNLIFTDLETACAIFDQPSQATSMLIECRPGYESRIKAALLGRFEAWSPGRSTIQPRVVTRADLESFVPASLFQREGVFTLHWLLGMSVSILVVLITSGAGLKTRRREIGIMKATGWQTDEILWRYSVESFLMSLAGASSSVILAYVWLEVFNGYWIANIFLPGIGQSASVDVPFQLSPVPTILAFVLSFVVVMSGTIYTSWRAATVSPREAMR